MVNKPIRTVSKRLKPLIDQSTLLCFASSVHFRKIMNGAGQARSKRNKKQTERKLPETNGTVKRTERNRPNSTRPRPGNFRIELNVPCLGNRKQSRQFKHHAADQALNTEYSQELTRPFTENLLAIRIAKLFRL